MGRFNRDGDADIVKLVDGLKAPTAQVPDLSTMRSELRAEMAKKENSAQPMMAHVTGKEADGPYVVCPQSYDRSADTVEVLKAADPKQTVRVPYKNCKVIKSASAA